MSAVDIAFVVVLAASVLLGLWRGMTRELVSVIAWIVIAVVAWRWAAPLGSLIPFDMGWAYARTVVGAMIIAVVGVLLSAIVGRILRSAVAASPLAGADRVLGGIFGAVRAGLVMMVVAAVVVEAGLSGQHLWKESASGPIFERIWRNAAGSVPTHHVPNVLFLGSTAPCAASSA